MRSHPLPWITSCVILALAYLAEALPPRPRIETINIVSLSPHKLILDQIDPVDRHPRRALTARISHHRTGSINAAIRNCTISAPSAPSVSASRGPGRGCPISRSNPDSESTASPSGTRMQNSGRQSTSVKTLARAREVRCGMPSTRWGCSILGGRRLRGWEVRRKRKQLPWSVNG